MVTIKKGTEHTEEFQPKPDEEAEREADEDIKRILEEIDFATLEYDKDAIAKQIRQLFEPKPDQSRLLTEELAEALSARFVSPIKENNLVRAREWLRQHSKEVDIIVAKTASIKDAELLELRLEWDKDITAALKSVRVGKDTECQARIEALIEALSKLNTCIDDNNELHIKANEWQKFKATHPNKDKESRSNPVG